LFYVRLNKEAPMVLRFPFLALLAAILFLFRPALALEVHPQMPKGWMRVTDGTPPHPNGPLPESLIHLYKAAKFLAVDPDSVDSSFVVNMSFRTRYAPNLDPRYPEAYFEGEIYAMKQALGKRLMRLHLAQEKIFTLKKVKILRTQFDLWMNDRGHKRLTIRVLEFHLLGDKTCYIFRFEAPADSFAKYESLFQAAFEKSFNP
jgi:hypothetical protein